MEPIPRVRLMTMQPESWKRLVGRWATEATHPELPGTVVTGQAAFEWLEDQRFLIQRSHFDHPEIPDALAVIGMIDGQRFTGTLRDDDNTIDGAVELSRDDGATWKHDLAITYRRID
jgi:hypothetical protein